MEFELQYLKAIQEYKLNIKDLPEDARIGIDNINDVQKAINMLKSKGRKPTDKTYQKLKAMDKWVYYEILDFVEDKDTNDDEPPFVADDVIDDLKNDDKSKSTDLNADSDNVQPNNNDDQNVALGILIETELTNMFESGVSEYTHEDIKKHGKKTYDLIFDTYEEGQPNGVKTTLFSLIEDSNKKFILTKN